MELSILTVTLGLPGMTSECLSSFVHWIQTIDHEVIIVDNGSTTKEKLTLESICDTFIDNGWNEGWCAVNKAVEKSSGKYLFLVNNDMFACRGWYDRLRYHLQEFDAIGPVSNAIYGDQIYPLSYVNKIDFFTKTDRLYLRKRGKCKRTHHLGGGAMLVSRKTWDEVGSLNNYGLGGHEDSEWCIRAKRKGKKLGVALDTFVHHAYQATYNALGIDYGIEMLKTKERISKEFGDTFTEELMKI